MGNTSKTTAWELGINNAGGQPYGLYVDPSGVVKMIERWIEYRCTYLGASFTLSPLLISGLVKVRGQRLFRANCQALTHGSSWAERVRGGRRAGPMCRTVGMLHANVL